MKKKTTIQNTGHIFTYRILIYIKYKTTTTVQNRSFLK